ncbi:hypothetical protein FUA23_03505 [Neolewinella aurantiaca]|uniref:Uncharacterized protein n=1 Tax=Neolewinella aurantiaca TaxID=2602767 RepID=A0A5C7FZW2_9BACT|nr:hypothetical protein [Neolewinella aurantiaca]TXF90876.1 hypothetical protein FUA23_03505 [Neolewinella aurantiaca]
MTRSNYFIQRLGLLVRNAPLRRKRLLGLLRKPVSGRGLLDVLFSFLDLIGLFDVYEAFTNAIFPGIRPLTAAEITMLRPIFGEAVPYDQIRIDERAYVGPSWSRFCYVSFHTINSWGPMSAPTLVHEVVHVWQYTHRGAAYIPRALHAQTTEMGYNYGGLEPLRKKDKLEDFNYEQQADIIEDAFRLANGWEAQWVKGRGAEILPDYYKYLEEVRSGQS